MLGNFEYYNPTKLYFGEQYGLKFFSRYGEGTTVHIIIPKVV